MNEGDDESAYVILHFGDNALALDVEESDMFWRQIDERWKISEDMVHFSDSMYDSNVLRVKVSGVVGAYEDE